MNAPVRQVDRMTLTFDAAGTIIEAARETAAKRGIAASLVVCDAAGHLKAFGRMDGAWLGSIDVAMRKARTAVLFEMETQAIWELCKPDAQAHGLETTNGGLVTFAGGVPIRSATGQLLGAIGVSGGQVAEDYAVAQAAQAAFVSLNPTA
jgi:uncharacterized protein GlcG (DUF336 family)